MSKFDHCGQCNRIAIGRCKDCNVRYCDIHASNHFERPCKFRKRASSPAVVEENDALQES